MTPDQRAGAANISLPWRALFPFPDASLISNDRARCASMYPNFSPTITSTTKLQHPVDYFLAGDKTHYGKGNARGRLLRHIFRE